MRRRTQRLALPDNDAYVLSRRVICLVFFLVTLTAIPFAETGPGKNFVCFFLPTIRKYYKQDFLRWRRGRSRREASLACEEDMAEEYRE